MTLSRAGLAAVATAVLLAGTASGQETNPAWKQNFGFELLLNQGYYSSNWQGDEQTSGALTASLDHQAARQLAKAVRFEHDIGLAFGEQLRERDSASGGGWETSKSDDRIELDELLLFTLGAWVDPLVSFQLRSQFTDIRDSNTLYLNPLQLLETFGAGRRFYDDSTRTLTTELGAAARQAWDVRDTTDLVVDAGVSWTTAFRTKVFSSNAGYSTRLVLYKPLLALGEETELGTWPQVNWEHELSARFNKVLSGKVYGQVLFDERIDDQPRLKQTLGMGLSLAWSN